MVRIHYKAERVNIHNSLLFIAFISMCSKRSEEQENITPVMENYLQRNDKKGPRIDPTHQAFLCPRVILYENCNMTLSSFLY